MAKFFDPKGFVHDLEEKLKTRVLSDTVVSIEALKNLKKKIKKKILIIEDDHFVRESLRRTLELDGHYVILAADAMGLVSLMDQFPVDLIILDVGLPWLNGYELAELMQSHPETKKIPLIFVSGHGDITDMKRGFKAGAGDYITKPFEIDHVRRTVNTLIELNS
jgi:two-component system aerobic respiration control protein ArcA